MQSSCSSWAILKHETTWKDINLRKKNYSPNLFWECVLKVSKIGWGNVITRRKSVKVKMKGYVRTLIAYIMYIQVVRVSTLKWYVGRRLGRGIDYSIFMLSIRRIMDEPRVLAHLSIYLWVWISCTVAITFALFGYVSMAHICSILYSTHTNLVYGGLSNINLLQVRVDILYGLGWRYAWEE